MKKKETKENEEVSHYLEVLCPSQWFGEKWGSLMERHLDSESKGLAFIHVSFVHLFLYFVKVVTLCDSLCTGTEHEVHPSSALGNSDPKREDSMSVKMAAYGGV